MSSVSADLRARLAQVDMSILELKLRLKSLEDNRQSIQDQLDSVVYPILTLPHEITSEIFLDCLPSPDVGSVEGPDVTEAPLLLLHVCRTWRDIALSTPHLWVHLYLNLRRIPKEVGVHGLEKVMADWFLRAGACPLSLSIYNRGNQSWAEAIRAVLLRYAPRLQSISLSLPRLDFQRLVNIGAFPILETFAVAFHSDGDEEERLEILDTAPRLRNLLCSEGAGPCTFLIPYGGLSTVTCESLSPDDLFDLLLCAPSLEDFTGCVRDEEIARLGTITHGRLQTLRFSDGCYLYFLRLLHLPALQNIHLATTIVTDECPDFFSFLARSSASLRRFSTSAFNTLDTDQFFTYMPYLTDIELFGPPKEFLLDFIQKLDRAQDKLFLPQLQNLALWDYTLDVVNAPLLQALTSRCTGDEESSILRSFRVDALPSYDDDDESQTTALRTLVEKGMTVFVGADKLWAESKLPNTALANDSQVN
ncbi:hypothetical protein DFH08DRAFT_117614 [Mycena albidolilacea]|uniref:F-box domain-containing protein n=1 Tax=Mycena albidolilacea TaxID=1033008 RepID=A0AAD7ETF3_9AGAR|nr:hypothetical protein DFH08DRAFT_117614 [Mycena albidolilacea]